MKRILTFLALCLPIYLFAQGFGSFSHDQPYFAKDSSSGPWTPPLDYMFRWWHAEDIGITTFTNWTDRFSSQVVRTWDSAVFTPRTNTANGIVSGPNGLIITNFATAVNPNQPWAVGMIFLYDPDPEVVSTDQAVFGTAGTAQGSGFRVFQIGANYNFYGNGQYNWLCAKLYTNVWYDLLICCTNPIEGASSGTISIYTNGVHANTKSGWTSYLPGVPNALGYNDNGVTPQQFDGLWKDWVVWTNFPINQIANYATTIHDIRTNLYGP